MIFIGTECRFPVIYLDKIKKFQHPALTCLTNRTFGRQTRTKEVYDQQLHDYRKKRIDEVAEYSGHIWLAFIPYTLLFLTFILFLRLKSLAVLYASDGCRYPAILVLLRNALMSLLIFPHGDAAVILIEFVSPSRIKLVKTFKRKITKFDQNEKTD